MGTRGCSMGGRTDGGRYLSCRERYPWPVAVADCPDWPVVVAVTEHSDYYPDASDWSVARGRNPPS